MIEVVIAFALTAVLIVSVYSTTNAASAVAERQRVAGAAGAQRARFLEVLERDLRGWVAQESVKPGKTSSGDAQVLISLTTTADALSGEAVDGPSMSAGRSAQVQYIVQPSVQEFQIVRLEKRTGAEPLSLVVYRGEAFKVEFFDGQQWVAEWGKGERPLAARLVFGNRSTYISL